MTEEHPGPDFLPYPRPLVVPDAPPVAAPSAAPGPGRGRWARALDGVPPLGVVAIGCGLGALVLLVIVSWVADRPGPGAVVTMLAAAASVGTGWRALRSTSARDSQVLVIGAQSVAVLSAVLAVVTYAATGSSDGVAPVTPPSASPSASASAPAQPVPTPGASVPPLSNRFFVPSMPGAPIVNDPTALGTLAGHVVNMARQPIAGAVVTVTRATAGDTSSTPQCPTRITTLTDANGVYQLQLCQLGDNLGYHVVIQTPRGKAETDLFVNSGNTTVYDVLLP